MLGGLALAHFRSAEVDVRYRDVAGVRTAVCHVAVKEYRDLADGEVPRRFIKIVLSVLTASEVLGIVHHNDLRSLARTYGELRAAPHLIGRTGNDLAVLYRRGVKVLMVKRRHAFGRRYGFVHNIDAKVDSRISVIGNGHRVSVLALCRGNSRRTYIFAVRLGSDVFVADIHRFAVLGRLDRICARFTVCISECGNDGLSRGERYVAYRRVVIAARRCGYRLDGIGRSAYPLILDGGLVSGILAHPALCFLRTAPMVEHDASGGGGKSVLASRLFGHLIHGLAVYVPRYRILFPKESVSMELLGSVEAEVVHMLVTAVAVDVIVELHLGGVLAEELDIYLVPGMKVALFVILLVRTGISEERARRARILARFHADGIESVMVPLGSTQLCTVIRVFGYSRFGNFGNSKLGDAVLVCHVFVVPLHIEHTAVTVTVRLEYDVSVRSVREIHDLFDLELGSVYRRAAARDGNDCREREQRGKRHEKQDILYLLRFHFLSPFIYFILFRPPEKNELGGSIRFMPARKPPNRSKPYRGLLYTRPPNP